MEKNQKKSMEKSIRLRDIFGSQYSFADDPSKFLPSSRKLEGGGDSAAPSATNNDKTATIPKEAPQKEKTTAQEAPRKVPRKKASTIKAAPTSSSTRTRRGPDSVSLRQRKATSSEERRQSSTRGSITSSKGKKGERADAKQPTMATAATATATARDFNEISLDPSLLDHPSEVDVEAAAANAFSGSFFQDEYSSHGHDEAENDSAQQQLMLPANILQIQTPIVATIPTARVRNKSANQDSSRKTILISCGICGGFLVAFFLIQVLPLLIWDSKPPDYMQVALQEQGNVVRPTHALTVKDLGKFPATTVDLIENHKGSPQFMAFAWMHADTFWQTYSVARRQERYILAVLYFSTNPPFQHTWKDPGHWLSYDIPECQWLYSGTQESVALDLCGDKAQPNDVNIASLPLASNNLMGILPPEVALLTNLKTVDFRGNPNLEGQIPDSWCKAVNNLQFDCATHSASRGLCGCDCPC